MFFLVSASPKTIGQGNFKLCRCIGHMMYRVLGNILCDLAPRSKSNNACSQSMGWNPTKAYL